MTSFSGKQAKEFAISLAKKIEDSTKIVNRHLEGSRNNMKKLYDKRQSGHRITEGDTVMLWWPYFKKGISRSFQPK